MLSAACVKTSSTTTTPGAPSEPPPSPDLRPSCDGWLPKPRHDCRPRVKAHCLRAYQPAHPVKLCKMGRKRAQQRRSGLFRRIAEHVRATLGDALWADFVSHANACYKDAFVSAFRKPILRFVPPPHGGACPHHFRVDVTCARAYTTLARRAAPGPRAGRGRDVRHGVGAGARSRALPRARPHRPDDGRLAQGPARLACQQILSNALCTSLPKFTS
jgi:hypothetical protein